MGNLSDKLKQAADYIEMGERQAAGFSSKLKETADYVEAGGRVLNYWRPSNKEGREKAKLEVQKWNNKTKWMRRRYVALWLVIIIATIYICIKVV